MTYCEDEKSYSLDCRCGEGYLITEDELEDNIDVINCSGCSLLIKVNYECCDETSE